MAMINTEGLANAPVNTCLVKGIYRTMIVKAEPIVSKTKNTPGIHFEGEIQDGTVQPNGSYPAGRHISWDIWIPVAPGKGRDSGLSKLKQLELCVGIEPSENTQTDEFVGKVVDLRTAVEEYNGEDKEKVQGYKAVK